jgi:aminopeptidase N
MYNNIKLYNNDNNNNNVIHPNSYSNIENLLLFLKCRWIALTHLEPIAARRFFPCWDEPALKATFNISVQHHVKYKALSNMPIREQCITKDGKVLTYFDTTPVMSTYLVAIALLDFARASENEIVHTWCRSHLIWHMKYMLNIAKKAT